MHTNIWYFKATKRFYHYAEFCGCPISAGDTIQYNKIHQILEMNDLYLHILATCN